MSKESQDEFITIDDMLTRARGDRARLAALWRDLSEAQMMARPGPQADWSVKDLIAHISFWEGALCDLLPRALQGESIDFEGTVADLNRSVHEEHRDQSLALALADFDASFARLESLLEELDDDAINDAARYQIFGKPLRHFIAANTTVHYADHLADLRAYVERL